MHPLRAGEAIDAAFALYRRAPGRLVRRTALVVVPAYLVVWVTSLPGAGSIGKVGRDELVVPRLPGSFALTSVDQNTVGFWLSIVIGLALVALAIGAGARPAVEAYLEDRAAHLPLRARPFRAAVLAAVLIVLSLLLLVVGALIAQAVLFVVAPAAVVEGIGADAACRRSARLSRGRIFPTLWWIALLQMIIMLVTMAAGIVVLGLLVVGDFTNVYVFLTAQLIVGAVLATLTLPLMTSLAVVAYFDRRIRSEGFDLALLVQDVGRIPAEPTFAEADRRFGVPADPFVA